MRSILLGLALIVSVPALAQPASPKFVGSWAGTLKQGTQEMEFTIHIAPADSGGFRAFLDIPAQNVRTMALADAAFHGTELSFGFGPVRYQGTVNDEGSAIAGKLTVPDGEEIPLDFSRSSAIPTLPATEAAVDDPDGFAGDFTGEIEIAGGLEATLHLRRTGDGYAATFDVPAQNARGLSADAVSIDGGVLSVTFGFGSYRATFAPDKSSLDGIWTQGGRDIALDMQRQ